MKLKITKLMIVLLSATIIVYVAALAFLDFGLFDKQISKDDTPPVSTIDNKGGTYINSVEVNISMNEEGTIYYTLDGSVPNLNSNIYTGKITITESLTLRYLCVDKVGNQEKIKNETYKIVKDDSLDPNDLTPPKTSVSVQPGTYQEKISVELIPNETATTYYTLDGSHPTTNSFVYSKPIEISQTTTLSFYSIDLNGNIEPLKVIKYVIEGSKPTIKDTTAPITTLSKPAGTYSQEFTLELSINEKGTIFYTLDGSAPTVNSTKYSSPIKISQTTTIKYFGIDSSGNIEVVKTATYVIKKEETLTSFEAALGYINDERAKLGLNPLQFDAKLLEAANIRAKEIVNIFDHHRLDNSEFYTVLTEKGINYSTCGENIAKYYDDYYDVVVNGWMNSEGHRKNILNGDFKYMAIGVYEFEGSKYFVQLFYA